MDRIEIISKERTVSGWQYVVDVHGFDASGDVSTFNVDLDDDTHASINAQEYVEEDTLIERLFTHLIRGESLESVPTNFDVDAIFDHYPAMRQKVLRDT